MRAPDSPARRAPAAMLFLALLGVSFASAPSAARDAPAPSSLGAADTLAMSAPSRARDRTLARWAENASLADLMFVLRRDPGELASAEAPLARAALERTPSARAALRRRLATRCVIADPKRSGKLRSSLDPVVVPHPRASVFRVAAALPDSGDYRDFARAVRAGLEVGLSDRAPGARPIDLVASSSGTSDAPALLRAFDRNADRCGAVVGELLTAPTWVLATATRYAGLPLISPTATDENLGLASPLVFQIGPSGRERALRLAGAVLGGSRRVGVLLASNVENDPFARGFEAAAESLGAEVVWREVYASGNVGFREQVKAIAAKRVEVLFWDGDASEVDALLKQLARERVSVKICGGMPLAPEQHHAETQLLLEGVQYVGDEWSLPVVSSAKLDSVLVNREARERNPVEIRGYLAGKMLASAIDAGALCPEEVAAWLADRRAKDPWLAARGFLDLSGEGVSLPFYTVSRGRAVRAW
jgi:ABC-type branched-subunit amino acid transport system substrate-binding protein